MDINTFGMILKKIYNNYDYKIVSYLENFINAKIRSNKII